MLIAMAVALVITVVAVVALDRPAPTTPDGAAAPTKRPSAPPPAPPPPVGTTYRDFGFANETVTAPTATKAQSKLWFAYGSWWAGLIQPTTNRVTIFRLDRESQLWQDTGTLVDERSFADPDFLFADDHLYVVSAGQRATSRHAGRVLRFSYDEAAGRFRLDRDFPVTITSGGTSAAVITRDSAGTLWVVYTEGSQVWLVRSVGDDARWSAPFPLSSGGAHVTPDDIATIAAFGPGQVGAMWSDQTEDRVYFSVHRDGDPDDAWSEPEIVVDGLGSSDDHINLKAYPVGDGTGLAAALKTSQDDVTPVNPLAPLILLATRPPEGPWQTYLVSRVRDRHTRAIVMVDADARQIYVAATSPARGGEILYKRSALDAISFDTGRGERLVWSPLDPQISNASSSKQLLSADSGLVVIASDNTTGRYLHAVVDLGGGLPAADPADASRPDQPEAPIDPEPAQLMDDTFEPWPIGDAAGAGWSVRDTDPPGSLSIVDDGSGGRALRVKAGADGSDVRACHDYPDMPESDLSATMRVKVGKPGTSDSILLSMRGSGGETVSIRATDRETLAWFDGPTKVRSGSTLAPGRWYRVAVTLDQSARTYSFRVTQDDGTLVLARKGIAWRSPDVESARILCVETAGGRPGSSIDLAEVRVQELPVP